MAFGTKLSDADLHAALALACEAANPVGETPFGEGVLEQLLRLIPADVSGYFEYRFADNALPVEVDLPVFEWTTPQDLHDALCAYLPLRDKTYFAHREPLRLSDVLSPRALRRNPYYQEILRRERFEYQLKVWLPAPAGWARAFYFARGPQSSDFDERDRALLSLLRPHLARARARWEERRHPPELTSRETQVLELVSQGLTNREIAARLVVSSATIRTHLEHAYEKLGVHTRTAAVARAFGSAA